VSILFFGVFQAEEFIYDGFKAITLKHFKMAAKMAAHSNYSHIFRGNFFVLGQMIPLYQGFGAQGIHFDDHKVMPMKLNPIWPPRWPPISVKRPIAVICFSC
jgi:hypothetical protein